MKTVIVSACPCGIANSALVYGILQRAATELQLDATFECQGITKTTPELDQAILNQAEIAILIGPVSGASRFNGKRIYQAEPGDCYQDPQGFLTRAMAEASVLNTLVDTTTEPTTNGHRIVAVTACPTGVAHTFMAAEALDAEAQRLGYQIKVETRGSVGAGNPLTAEDIAQADVVIVAADIEVDLSRFHGKKLYRTSTGAALKKTTQEVARALSEGQIYQGSGKSAHTEQPEERTGVYKHLMTGVSHMLPFVVAGGLAVALSFIFGIEAFKQPGTLPDALMRIGSNSAFALMVPILAGYIAFSIADRPGLAPGMIGGMLASATGAGFLGGIVAGFLAGYSSQLVATRLPVPASMQALKPILIIPLLASLVTGLVMIYVVGTPVAALMNNLTTFLNTMGTANAVLLGALLGAMMCVDLGGPINKAAYTFGVGLLGSQTYMPMAAVMAAGMVPPLGMGLATFMARNRFTLAEQEAGKAAIVLGMCFISEGAIPFAARDPVRVIPSCMLGGALTGALSMLFSVKLMAPHGGLFVLLIPNAVSPVLPYLLSIMVGTAATGIIYGLLKRLMPAVAEPAELAG